MFLFNFCAQYIGESLRKVSLIQQLLPVPLTYCCGSNHGRCGSNHGRCGSTNQCGWPGPYECLVVDPLNMHVVIWPLRAGPGPPRAGPGPLRAGPRPPQAGPGLLARIARSAD